MNYFWSGKLYSVSEKLWSYLSRSPFFLVHPVDIKISDVPWQRSNTRLHIAAGQLVKGSEDVDCALSSRQYVNTGCAPESGVKTPRHVPLFISCPSKQWVSSGGGGEDTVINIVNKVSHTSASYHNSLEIIIAMSHDYLLDRQLVYVIILWTDVTYDIYQTYLIGFCNLQESPVCSPKMLYCSLKFWYVLIDWEGNLGMGLICQLLPLRGPGSRVCLGGGRTKFSDIDRSVQSPGSVSLCKDVLHMRGRDVSRNNPLTLVF